MLAVQRDADLDVPGQAVVVAAFAIPGEDDALDGGRRGQLDLRPARDVGRDPTVVVASLAIVQVLDAVDGVPLQARRSRRLGAGRGQGQVLVRVRPVDFQLVDAGLAAAGLVDRQPDVPRLAGGNSRVIGSLVAMYVGSASTTRAISILLDGLPRLAVVGDLDLQRRREPVLVVPLAVAGKDNPVDRGRLRQLDLGPAGTLGGNPTPGVAVLAVVQMGHGVGRMAFQARRRRGLGAGGGQGQVLVALRSVDFQFVDAGLRPGLALDGHPHEPGGDGVEAHRVGPAGFDGEGRPRRPAAARADRDTNSRTVKIT